VISSLNRALSSLTAGIAEFLRLESIGGMMLVAAAAVAMIWANSALADYYEAVLNLPVSIRAGDMIVAKALLLWINDGLMAIFFLLVGLEIKREMIAGELSTLDRTLLPGIAAIGGMAVPALVYVAVNISDPVTLRGWAIPTATDIAFALGVAALLGDRIPPALKILLLALAIIDDLGAIVIIALFYSAELSTVSLVLSGFGLAILLGLNRIGITRLAPYMLVGIFVWVCVLKSGVHATLAGVALAFAIPIGNDPEMSPLHRLEHTLHGWVSYGILPLFAFANAGVPLTGLTLGTMLNPVPLGVALGLLIGKPCGVMAASFAAVRLGLVRLPAGVGWPLFFGMSLLTGIGFTMSLFIGGLAFSTDAHESELRIGILVGSLLSAIAGYAALRAVSTRHATPLS
jgi:NhaA family Na+:H+ antiporter